jgi:hypothetical protein
MARKAIRIGVWTTEAAAAAWLLLSPAAFGQSYGPNLQELVIGAASFHAEDPLGDPGRTNGFGFLANVTPNLVVLYDAPLDLPEGAEITQICLYAYDPDPSSTVNLHLERIILPPASSPPGVYSVASAATLADFDIGYGVACASDVGYTVQAVQNLDGNDDHVAHRLRLFLQANGGFGGARVIWRRKPSPLPAASSFDDVPLGSAYSQFIEALKASGITAGCQASPPLYCPDRPITRAEMAVYLSLALGLNWNADAP